MLSIGFLEILVIAVLGLLVFGPEKLPEAIRTFAFGMSKIKRSWSNTRRELEQELGMDEIRKEIHNAQIMEDLELIKNKTKASVGKFDEELKKTLDDDSAILSQDAQEQATPASDSSTDETASEPRDT